MPVGGLGFDVGMVEVYQKPPGLSRVVKTRSRFEAFTEQGQQEWDVGGLGVKMPIAQINAVESKRTEDLRPAGRGKITIDSGAAESVLPTDMLPSEKLVDGEARKKGVRHGQLG
jgi:hypothetical protein